jgi:pentose-5-phosphate-3-epimerase
MQSSQPYFKRFLKTLTKEERQERKRQIAYIKNFGKKSGLGIYHALKFYTYEEVLEKEDYNLKFYGKKIIEIY